MGGRKEEVNGGIHLQKIESFKMRKIFHQPQYVHKSLERNIYVCILHTQVIISQFNWSEHTCTALT